MWKVVSQFDKIDFLIITVIDGFRNRHHSIWSIKHTSRSFIIALILSIRACRGMKLNVIKDNDE